jgi:hypothetical protein
VVVSILVIGGGMVAFGSVVGDVVMLVTDGVMVVFGDVVMLVTDGVMVVMVVACDRQ